MKVDFQVQFKLYEVKTNREIIHDTCIVSMNHDIKDNNDLGELRCKLIKYLNRNLENYYIGIIDYKPVKIIG